MEPHLSREIRESFFSAFKSYSKECVRQGLGHCAERLLCIFRAYHLSESESEWALRIVAFLVIIVKSFPPACLIYWLAEPALRVTVTLIFEASPGRLESQNG